MGRANYDYEGETVLVTGGSSGIGREIATRFAEAGAAIVVADVREEPRDRGETTPTHEVVRERGGDAAFVGTDVSDPEQVEAAVDAAREFGGVDVMVNNAGVHVTESIRSVDPETFDRVHAVNVKGTFFGCQAAANDMIDRGAGGVVLNVASISSTGAKPRQVAYESTKGAVRMITLSAAVELAEHDVRVNAIAPGRIATEFGLLDAEETERSGGEGIKPIPAGRAGRPEDVAGAALYLACEDADYVTGELLYVDGGYSAI